MTSPLRKRPPAPVMPHPDGGPKERMAAVVRRAAASDIVLAEHPRLPPGAELEERIATVARELRALETGPDLNPLEERNALVAAYAATIKPTKEGAQ
jgi:hypothetical protein